jgi:hypothetical protein
LIEGSGLAVKVTIKGERVITNTYCLAFTLTSFFIPPSVITSIGGNTEGLPTSLLAPLLGMEYQDREECLDTYLSLLSLTRSYPGLEARDKGVMIVDNNNKGAEAFVQDSHGTGWKVDRRMGKVTVTKC